MLTVRLGWLVASFAVAYAQTAGLPVERVVLYKNGVGYFEHLGKVNGAQKVEIGFTSGQLNDVLKSLTVLDLNGGRIAGVGYGSANPVANSPQTDHRSPMKAITDLQ
jgi:hypothetical protein